MIKKQANFQLLKIIAMIMIVSHHLVAKNAFNVDTDVIGLMPNKLLLQVLGNNAFIGNNLFFLISAWFLSSKTENVINLRYSIASCIRLERVVLFFSISLLCLTLVLGRGKIELSLVLKSLFPTLSGVWWYPTTYIVFLLIWPFYHKGLNELNVDELKKCITVMFIIWSGSTLIPFVDLGTSNFCAFLMLYAIIIFVKKRKIIFSKKQCFSLMIFPYITGVISIIVLDMLGIKINMAATYSCYYMRGNFRPISMLVSLGFFMWSVSWNIKCNRWINYIADATFGVYLFHMYPTVMKYLFSHIFVLEGVIDKWYCVLYLMGGTIMIFGIGVLIDKSRECVFCFIKKIRGCVLTQK